MREFLSDDRFVRRIEWTNAVFLAILAAGAWLLYSVRIAGGVLLGGIVSIVSFEMLKWQLRRAFRNPQRIPGKGSLFLSYYLRFLGTAFVVFVVIYYKWVHPIPFVIGLSVVVFSITWVGIGQYYTMLQRGER